MFLGFKYLQMGIHESLNFGREGGENQTFCRHPGKAIYALPSISFSQQLSISLEEENRQEIQNGLLLCLPQVSKRLFFTFWKVPLLSHVVGSLANEPPWVKKPNSLYNVPFWLTGLICAHQPAQIGVLIQPPTREKVGYYTQLTGRDHNGREWFPFFPGLWIFLLCVYFRKQQDLFLLQRESLKLNTRWGKAS